MAKHNNSSFPCHWWAWNKTKQNRTRQEKEGTRQNRTNKYKEGKYRVQFFTNPNQQYLEANPPVAKQKWVTIELQRSMKCSVEVKKWTVGQASLHNVCFCLQHRDTWNKCTICHFKEIVRKIFFRKLLNFSEGNFMRPILNKLIH